MNLSLVRRIASNPDAYSTQELDEALSFIVDTDKLSEKQVSNLQAKIDPVLRKRIETKVRTYPAGTDIRDIRHFDRGEKVTFNCLNHPNVAYRSKDPFVSQWFPANEETQMAEIMGNIDSICAHTLRTGTWVTSTEYESEDI